MRVCALALHSEQPPLLRLPGYHFPTKSRYDVIGVSSGDVPMMWGFLMTFTSQLHHG